MSEYRTGQMFILIKILKTPTTLSQKILKKLYDKNLPLVKVNSKQNNDVDN